MGHLHEGKNVFVDTRHIREALLQVANDLGHRALAVDLLENFAGAVVVCLLDDIGLVLVWRNSLGLSLRRAWHDNAI